MRKNRIALIGSFRKHYNIILDIYRIFDSACFKITTPLGYDIITGDENKEFVRFVSDNKHFTDSQIESIAIKRIMIADIVYVIAPDGYIGRTTSYEIGCVIQSRHPIYFSERIKDLPIHIPSKFIVDASQLINLVNNKNINFLY